MFYFFAVLMIGLLSIFSRFIYNRIIDREHWMDISRGRLEAELQRREDLRRNAIKAVDLYVETERRLMHHLIHLAREVKSGASSERIAMAEGEIERFLSEMDILVEKTPLLKSKGPYLYLMDIFVETERKVLSARLDYNRNLSEYDMLLDLFPYSLAKWMFGFKILQPFTATKGAARAPEVDLLGDGGSQ